MVPEALNFLQNSLLLLLPMSPKAKGLARQICVEAAVPMPDFGEEHARSLSLSNYKGTAPETGRAELFALLNGSTKGAQAIVLPLPNNQNFKYRIDAMTATNAQGKVWYSGTGDSYEAG